MANPATDSLCKELEEADSGLLQSVHDDISDFTNSIEEDQSESPSPDAENLPRNIFEESTAGSLDSFRSHSTFCVTSKRNVNLVKPIRIYALSSDSQTTSTPRPTKSSAPPRIVNSVRSVAEISSVRINRAYELRFIENQEKEYLRNARRIAYSVYIATAKVLNRVPDVELAAGFP